MPLLTLLPTPRTTFRPGGAIWRKGWRPRTAPMRTVRAKRAGPTVVQICRRRLPWMRGAFVGPWGRMEVLEPTATFWHHRTRPTVSLRSCPCPGGTWSGDGASPRPVRMQPFLRRARRRPGRPVRRVLRRLCRVLPHDPLQRVRCDPLRAPRRARSLPNTLRPMITGGSDSCGRTPMKVQVKVLGGDLSIFPPAPG